jgi:class 3 adenylate cyclase
MNNLPRIPFQPELSGAAAASSDDAKTISRAIMFTTSGFGAARAELGTKRYAEMLMRHGELFRVALSVSPPGIEKHTGDGFMARFTGPSDAVATALHFQWLLRRGNGEWQPAGAVGIHEGQSW